jgi:hypothetical protein
LTGLDGPPGESPLGQSGIGSVKLEQVIAELCVFIEDVAILIFSMILSASFAILRGLPGRNDEKHFVIDPTMDVAVPTAFNSSQI